MYKLKYIHINLEVIFEINGAKNCCGAELGVKARFVARDETDLSKSRPQYVDEL